MTIPFPEDLDGFLWRPVLNGMWSQSELYDGTYDFKDLCDAHRFLDWKLEMEDDIRRQRERS